MRPWCCWQFPWHRAREIPPVALIYYALIESENAPYRAGRVVLRRRPPPRTAGAPAWGRRRVRPRGAREALSRSRAQPGPETHEVHNGRDDVTDRNRSEARARLERAADGVPVRSCDERRFGLSADGFHRVALGPPHAGCVAHGLEQPPRGLVAWLHDGAAATRRSLTFRIVFGFRCLPDRPLGEPLVRGHGGSPLRAGHDGPARPTSPSHDPSSGSNAPLAATSLSCGEGARPRTSLPAQGSGHAWGSGSSLAYARGAR